MKISGYSTALFSTWFFLEELGILFDAGDGITSTLTQKARSIKHVFISHADRDHLTGLLQFIQLNARENFPKIYYPSDCGSFLALKKFSEKFDPHVPTLEWVPMNDGDEFAINNDTIVKVFKNNHVEVALGITKSLSFIVEKKKQKLKPEFHQLSGTEIGRLRKEYGEDYITEEIKELIIGYSGDSPVGNATQWAGVKGLIHESTFLEKGKVEVKGNNHSSLDELLPMVSTVNPNFLILSHFSARYKKLQIEQQIQTLINELNISFPVYLIPPNESVIDILSRKPLLLD